jgi:hypothetical protein
VSTSRHAANLNLCVSLPVLRWFRRAQNKNFAKSTYQSRRLSDRPHTLNQRTTELILMKSDITFLIEVVDRSNLDYNPTTIMTLQAQSTYVSARKPSATR